MSEHVPPRPGYSIQNDYLEYLFTCDLKTRHNCKIQCIKGDLGSPGPSSRPCRELNGSCVARTVIRFHSWILGFTCRPSQRRVEVQPQLSAQHCVLLLSNL